MSKINAILRPIGKVFGFDAKTDKPPKPPAVSDKAIVEEKEKQRRALALRKGYTDTILTPPTGVTGGDTVTRKTLLGG